MAIIKRPISSVIRPVQSTGSRRPGNASQILQHTPSKPEVSTPVVINGKNMKEVESQQRVVQIRKPFFFRGNWDVSNPQQNLVEGTNFFCGEATKAEVRKYNNALGDGEMGTRKNSQTYAEFKASLKEEGTSKIRLTVTYTVWESDFGQKQNQDKLTFTASNIYDMSEFVSTGNENDLETVVSWKFEKQPTEAFVTDIIKGDMCTYIPVNRNTFAASNKVPFWLDAKELLFKVDGNGNDLNGVGNIGVRGFVDFNIVVTTKVYEEAKVEKPATGVSVIIEKEQGDKPVQEFIDPERIGNVLCCGYDITGKFASAEECKEQVLDLDELNKFGRLKVTDCRSTDVIHVNDVGMKEASKTYEKSLEITGSLSIGGFACKSENEKTSKNDNYKKDNYRIVSTKALFNRCSYEITRPTDIKSLLPFLSKAFVRDLETESADKIIEFYGTHVVLGMNLGARYDYSMSYLQSISRISSCETFMTSNSVSYNSQPTDNASETVKSASKAGASTKGPSGSTQPESKAKEAAQAIQNISGNTFSDCVVNNTINITTTNASVGDIASGLSGAGNNGGKGGDGNKDDKGKDAKSSSEDVQWSISCGVKYGWSESSDVNEENESTNISITAAGGDGNLLFGVVSGDSADTSKWVDSIKPENYVFIGFPKKTLIPIFEFVADKAKAQAVKDACIEYLVSGGSESASHIDAIIPQYAELSGSNETVIRTRGSDDDISTTEKGITQIKLRMDAMNIDGGKVALGVCYIVSEGDMNGGRSTMLQMSRTVDFPADYDYKYAVSPSVKGCYESGIFTIKGKVHGWVDITELVENCPFVETKSHRVMIKIDGSGSDKNNIGIKAQFQMPTRMFKK